MLTNIEQLIMDMAEIPKSIWDDMPNDTPLKRPITLVESITKAREDQGREWTEEARLEAILAAEAVGAARLSSMSRKAIDERLAILKADSKRRQVQHKPHPSTKGRRHWKKKRATLERRKTAESFGYVLNGYKYKCKKLDREEWDNTVGDIIRQHGWSNIQLKWLTPGTKKEPYRLETLEVYDRRNGKLLFDGRSYELWKSSGGSSYTYTV